MKALIQLTVVGVVIEGLGLLGFIGVAKTTLGVPGKQVIIVLTMSAIIAVLGSAARVLSFWELTSLALLLSVGAVAISQILGFVLFPGLVKNVTPLSWDHFRKPGTTTIVIFGSYMGIICLIVAIKRLLKF